MHSKSLLKNRLRNACVWHVDCFVTIMERANRGFWPWEGDVKGT